MRACVGVLAASPLTAREHVVWWHKPDFIVLGTAQGLSAPLAGDPTEEIQVSRVHGHRRAFAGPDTHGGEVSGPPPRLYPSLRSPLPAAAGLWNFGGHTRTTAGSP